MTGVLVLFLVQTIDFASQVWPVLEQKCVRCHGPEKQKAKLRLDLPEALLKKVVIPGDAKGSPLFQRVSLPSDDADAMPPEGEGHPLSREEQERLRAWIDGKAVFGTWTGVRAVAEPMPDGKAIEALRAFGAVVTPLFEGSALLAVDFAPVAERTRDADLTLLQPLASHVSWLSLARTKISDAGVGRLVALGRLERLHLEQTQIGDGGVAQLGGREFQYLNLFGTKVTEDALCQLNARRLVTP